MHLVLFSQKRSRKIRTISSNNNKNNNLSKFNCERPFYVIFVIVKQMVLFKIGMWVVNQTEIIYSMETTVTFFCLMRFDNYPLDYHSCQFQVGSYSLGGHQLLFSILLLAKMAKPVFPKMRTQKRARGSALSQCFAAFLLRCAHAFVFSLLGKLVLPFLPKAELRKVTDDHLRQYYYEFSSKIIVL